MKEKFGKMEASHIGKNNSMIMIVSIIAVTLFIGTAVQPAIATTIHSQGIEVQEAEEECIICAPRSDGPTHGPACKTCGEAVEYAVGYMKVYVKEKMKDVNETYFLWSLDVVFLISEGIHIGLKNSGFKIEIDREELNENIEYWVNKTVGPQMFNVTIFLAKLGAISIGVTGYLLTICNGEVSKNSPVVKKQIWSIFSFMPRFFRWIKILNLPVQ